MTTRIALTGVVGSGKSTAADYFAAHGYIRTKFAGPLKDMMRALYTTAGLASIDIERRIEGDLKEQPDKYLNGVTPRRAMQTLGTEWRDLVHRDLWISLWERTVASLADKPLVVDDCRFDFEHAAVKRAGFVVAEIIRPGAGTKEQHASEAGTGRLPDYRVHNNGSKEDLYRSLKLLMGALDG